jgi:glutamate racemase
VYLAVVLHACAAGNAAEGGRSVAAGTTWPVWPEKEEIKVAVTDSGLGGLAIMAELAARFEAAGVARRVDLVFFNALFANDSGYNSLPAREDRVRMFDRALAALTATERPDLIVIGCNTLSVLFPETEMARNGRVPAVGIVEAGVELFRRELARRPEAALLMFGTETTIGDGTHRAALERAGIARSRVVPQACPELAAYIENNWRGEETELMVAAMAGEAASALPAKKPPVFVGLVCSHYGYAAEAWVRAMAESGVEMAGVLDPNRELVARLCPPGTKGRYARSEITVRVVSKVEIASGKRRTLGAWLEKVSPRVAAALERYEWRPDLF